jgi:hypothetical protein
MPADDATHGSTSIVEHFYVLLRGLKSDQGLAPTPAAAVEPLSGADTAARDLSLPATVCCSVPRHCY